ncbi:MAG TPA: glycoside hydrolase family 65 protein, partial [Acidimicrobiia bacterium]|nr:glycoside hydrolase family 65 protein [Acidimicrobiia bacterium]
LRTGTASLSGLEGEHPVARIACVPAGPYPLAGDIRVGSVWMSDQWGRVRDVEQRYDFERGELHTAFRFHSDGVTVTVQVVTFCSRSQPSLAAQEVVVVPDHACEIEIAAGIDPRNIAGRWLERCTTIPGTGDDDVDAAMLWETLGALGSCGCAYWTEAHGPETTRSKSEEAGAPLSTAYRAQTVRKNQRFVVRQVTSMIPSSDHQQPHWHATRLAALGREIGFDSLRKDNAAAWKELWRSRVVLLNADARWQSLADAAFFYLHTSTHPGSFSTHPFGLAQWHGYHYYYGHVMWDVESFLLPPLILTNPDAALAMLEYRMRGMAAARENARLGGFRGLQFPWEASPSKGEEAAPGLGPAAAYEHHVSLDVARAFADYANATGDDVFLTDRAWPVLSGIAEWIVSRATQTRRGWEIHKAMGIAEREKPADNPAFVNMTAVVALRAALRCAARMGVEPPDAWRSMAEHTVLPLNRNRVIIDHDGYTVREDKASTPAALAGIFPGGYAVDERVERATLEFYLDMADDYAGSPMLSPLLGAWAAMLGDRRRSAALFEEGYAKFSSDRFNIVYEYRPDKFPDEPRSGPFMANMGGFLISCMYGLTGLRIGPGDPSEWCTKPVVMPELWDGVEIERLNVRGREASLHAKHGDAHATLELHEGVSARRHVTTTRAQSPAPRSTVYAS